MTIQAVDNNPKKDVALEALRGLAAITVMIWHSMLAFVPLRVPVLGGDQSASIMGRPWFGLIYGTSAVTFFFVLSGFVLSRKALLKSDTLALARGAVKRWPRLAAIVGIATLFSWLLFTLHAYRYQEASAVTGSPWLASFGTSIPVGTPFKPKFGRAATSGFFYVFFRGDPADTIYDSSLWTMPVEFLGSFLVFGLAALLIALKDMKARVRAILIAFSLIIAYYAKIFMVCFIAGVALAAILGDRRPVIRLWQSLIFASLAIWMAGYVPGQGWYGWLNEHFHFRPTETLVHTAASTLAILVIETSPRLRKLLSGWLSEWLGRLSFPLYLLHAPIIFSAGSAVYLALSPALPSAEVKIVAIATVFVATTILAIPLAKFDVWWVGKTNGWANRMVPRPKALSNP